MSDPTEKLEDDLGLTGRLEAILRARIPLEALPLPAAVAACQTELGWQDLHLFAGPKIERLSIHRFFIRGRLREHLCLLWPGDDYDLPALGLDIYEHAADFTLVADFIPTRDLAFAPDYYDRYYQGFAALVGAFWPTLLEHVVTPLDPPSMSFSRQMGSCLGIHHRLRNSGLEAACAFQEQAASVWCDLWDGAAPLTGAEREAYNQRRRPLIEMFKRRDYASGASAAMARVVGQEVTDGLFDAIFG